MSSRTLNPSPSWKSLVWAQLRLLAVAERRQFIVLALLVGAFSALAAWGLTRGSVQGEWTEHATTFPLFTVVNLFLILIAVLWPTGVWRHEPPSERGYFWALPVGRSAHTFFRVGVGWVLLMGVCVAVLHLAAFVAFLYEVRFPGFRPSFAFWYLPLTSATLTYILKSVHTVLSPPSWVRLLSLVILLGVVLVRAVSAINVGWLNWLADVIWGMLHSLLLALFDPIPVTVGWRPFAFLFDAPGGLVSHSYFLWLAGGVVALAVASMVHREA